MGLVYDEVCRLTIKKISNEPVSVMKNLIVFFYIDALNSSFLTSDTMPFLSSLAKKHSCCELENVLGYSFAIQSCMLSGKYPEETNHWLPYFYSPRESPILFRTLNKVGAVFPIDRFSAVRHLMVDQIRRFLLKEGVRTNNVPLTMIDKLALYPYYYMCELPFFNELKELLDKKCQASLTYMGPPKLKKHLYGSLLKYIRASKYENELIIAYDDALDGLGHRFGPYSTECLDYANSLDRLLFRVYEKLEKRFGKSLTFLVFSDHGQCRRAHSLDLLSELQRKALHFAEDYLCFVDATMALFWPQSVLVKEKILNILHEMKIGKVVDEDLRERYHIKFNDARFGEIIFVLKPGGTFFPNFFSPFSAMRGLHGYFPEDEVQKGFLISSKQFSYQPKHVKDLRNLLLEVSSYPFGRT